MQDRIEFVGSVDQLVARAGWISLNETTQKTAEGEVAEGIGWHLYGDLRIHSRYVCAPDVAQRRQVMRALTRFGQIGLAVANKYRGQLLEHQGQRIHLWLPDEVADHAVVWAALSEIDTLVRAHVRPILPSGWKSYASSADHGHTVFVRSTNLNSGDSIVSLAPSANRPAKELPKLSDCEIWIAGKTLTPLPSPLGRDFYGRDAADPDSVEAQYGPPELLTEAAAAISKQRQGAIPDGAAPYFGYVFRADIDGFSALVRQAFQNRGLLQSLVLGFLDTTKQVTHYARTTPTEAFVQLPWAGDCCSLIAIHANHAEYSRARESKTAVIPIEFENSCGSSSVAKRFGNVGWAYSIAGGDVHGNQLGNMLISNIALGHRTFLIAAGKGVRRSLDAESQIPIGREEVALFSEDKACLQPHFSAPFQPANSNFHLASVADLEKAARLIGAGTRPLVTSTTLQRPAPRPYYGGD